MLPDNYASTDNKNLVRLADAELIKKECKRKNKKLSYLGMPSGEMLDILSWRNYLDRCSAVEIDEQQRSKLILKVISNGMMGKIGVLYGNIEDILIKGKDKFGNRLLFPYDLVFLDCFGTLLYNGLKRVKAISSLIEKQKGNSFLFLLTFNLNHKNYCKHAVDTSFKKLERELLNSYPSDIIAKNKIKHFVSWYAAEDTNEMYRQKLFAPYFVKTKAEERDFRVHTYSPTFYLGSNNSPMIHFAFKLTSDQDAPTKAVSEQSMFDIINLNLKEASEGRISIMEYQAPTLNI
jgi:hypothetical protein